MKLRTYCLISFVFAKYDTYLVCTLHFSVSGWHAPIAFPIAKSLSSMVFACTAESAVHNWC